MPISQGIEGQRSEIRLPMKFIFADGSDFRKKLFAAFQAGSQFLSLDLSETKFMDSAGLGMLLVALKECQARSISLTLVRPHGEVRKLLELTRSNERFHIID
jgi:anti-sigma B factor antagonist